MTGQQRHHDARSGPVAGQSGRPSTSPETRSGARPHASVKTTWPAENRQDLPGPTDASGDRWWGNAVAAKLSGDPLPPHPELLTVPAADRDRLVSARRAASIVGVSVHTIHRWRRVGRLRWVVDGDGHPVVDRVGARQFRLSDVLALGKEITRQAAERKRNDEAVDPWLEAPRMQPPPEAAALALAMFSMPWHRLSRLRRRHICAWRDQHLGWTLDQPVTDP